MQYFTFDDIPSTDYGVYVVSSNIFDSAEEDVETVDIPYSNNTVHLSKGSFKPFIIKTECIVYDSMASNLDSFRNFLQSRGKACKYVDSSNPNEFRIARFKKAFAVRETDYINSAAFSLEFEAKPQRYLTSGETFITVDGVGVVVNNHQSFASKPLLRIKTSGYCECGVGNYNVIIGNSDGMTIFPMNDYIEIDCETMQCYAVQSMQGGSTMYTNVNYLVSLPNGFPELKPGNNLISRGPSGSAATWIEVKPRWWKL